MTENQAPKSLTKQYIWDKYQELLQLSEQSGLTYDPMKEAQDRKVDTASGVLKDLSKSDNVRGIFDEAQTKFNGVLNQLSVEVLSSIKRFDDLEIAIEAKQSELEELLGIETASLELVTLANTKTALMQELESKIRALKEEQAQVIKQNDEEFRKIRKEALEELTKEKEQASKEYAREQEQIEYDDRRKRTQKIDALEDDLAIRRKEHELELQQERDLYDQDVRELERREEAILIKEQEFEELKSKVENFPDVLKRAEEASANRASAIAKANAESERKIFEAEHNAKIKIFESNVSSLQAQNQKLEQEKIELLAKLDSAYSRIETIAKPVAPAPQQR